MFAEWTIRRAQRGVSGIYFENADFSPVVWTAGEIPLGWRTAQPVGWDQATLIKATTVARRNRLFSLPFNIDFWISHKAPLSLRDIPGNSSPPKVIDKLVSTLKVEAWRWMSWRLTLKLDVQGWSSMLKFVKLDVYGWRLTLKDVKFYVEGYDGWHWRLKVNVEAWRWRSWRMTLKGEGWQLTLKVVNLDVEGWSLTLNVV